MRRELNLFFCALQFLTRLPTPRLKHFEPSWIARSTRYASLVGQIVGAIGAGVLFVSARVWSGWLPALLAVAATVLVTGAFHEDGLADTADGLGGGQSKARRLAIMKDSHVGSYGVLALCLSLAVRVGALAQLPPTAALACLIAMHGLGRAAAVAAMAMAYVGSEPQAKLSAAEPPGWGNITMACVVALWPLAFLTPGAAVLGCILGAALAATPALAARRLIGGRTGDILGAVEQMMEVGFVLGVAAVLSR